MATIKAFNRQKTKIMNEQLKAYIAQKRKAGLTDDQVRTKLLAAGWKSELVDSGLKVNLEDDVPAPPPDQFVSGAVTGPAAPLPIAVVNVSSTRGIEYSIMFIGLWIGATSIAFLLHSTIDHLAGKGGFYEAISPYAGAAAIVALPIFLLLFLRLKKAELSDPGIRKDPSRTRALQLTLLVTFLIGIFKIIGYVFSLMNGGSDTGSGLLGGSGNTQVISPMFDLLHALVTLGIAGGIFTYYWIDLHKKTN